MESRGWPQVERPRERLFNKAAASLSDSRAVGRNTANSHRGQDFAGYCERHAQPLWGLVGLLTVDCTSLTENPEIGAAKAARFAAMKELSQRHTVEGYLD